MGYALHKENPRLGQKVEKPRLHGVEGVLSHCPAWKKRAANDETVSRAVLPGQYFDVETNLHYNHHRYYDPELGRYITVDPLSVVDQMQMWADLVATTQSSVRVSSKFAGSENLISVGLGPPPLELNPYAYVMQNPIGHYDPLGLMTCDHYAPGSTLEFICENSPGDEGKLECVRKCLRDNLPPDNSNPNICEAPDWYFYDHPVCWWDCDYIPWPY